MSGIYLHIPFCRRACHYCNFHFSTSLAYRGQMVTAITQELEQQRDYLEGETIETIYFGGGTPSLLDVAELKQLFAVIQAHYPLAKDMEITLEANPDDLTPDKITALRNETPINRLSIGIQSFFDADLQFMNRAHSSQQAYRSIEDSIRTGFSLLTVDLIYGIPGSTDAQWLQNLQTVFDYGIPHLSCYALTVEPQTALAHFIQKGKSAAPEDEHTAHQFELLLAATRQQGYEQYEISNFCIPPHYARHNSSYWRGAKYLGVGPSAHSFNGTTRQWNVANNQKYLKRIAAGEIPCEIEILSPENQYNEYLMTALRTKWGVDAALLDKWGRRAYFEQQAAPYVASQHLQNTQGIYTLTDNGKLISDAILTDLFVGAGA